MFGVSLLVALVSAFPVPAQPESQPVEITESLTVTDTRLRDRDEDEVTIPGHMTVLTRDEIQAAGADTLQDLLAIEAGVIVFDQVGDDVSKTFDLRGFRGTGTRVFLNGAPLNEPRNNSLALELVSLRQLDRVEITRGSATALAGSGAEAGVINLWTRRGGDFNGSLSYAAGDFGTQDQAGDVSGSLGRTDLALSGSIFNTDGFRDNSSGDLSRLALDLGWDLSDSTRLDLSYWDASAEFGNPGALTVGELGANRDQAPFNALDFTDEDFSQAVLNLTSTSTESFTWAANLYGRDSRTEALTTGRSAPAFGGFRLGTDTSVVGSTLQGSYASDRDRAANTVTVGIEYLDGETEARGFGTAPGALGVPAFLSSDNLADRETLAFYIQDRWQLSERFTLNAGARYDQDRVAYRETFPDAANDDGRDFSEVSIRAGLAYGLSPKTSLYASFGEAFLPPTVEDLFSFPLFGSNPNLQPQDSRSLELGFRGRFGGGGSIDVALFEIDTENEIIFDPDSPLGLFGANVNRGAARRRGLELGGRVGLGDSARVFGSLTLMEAEFDSGVNAGKALPLVPEERLSVGFETALPGNLDLRLVALHVGEQVLDNDDANAVSTLASYTVVTTRVTLNLGSRQAFKVFVDARNLLDEKYATRGIFAFDFQTFTNEIFLTPAPGRRVMGGVEWSF